MQDYDINLAPGAVRVIDAQADYIYYRAGSAGGADASLEFSSRSGGETIFLYPGQAYKIPARVGAMGSGWALKNRKGEATIIGSVILGEGEFQDNRISGSVEVIDGGKSRTLANMAFVAAANALSDATSAPACYLQNPVGSGKIIVVKAMNVSVMAAQAYGVAWVPSVTGVDVTAVNLVSKSQQGAFASKVFKHETGARAVATQGSLATDNLPDNGRAATVFQEPIVIRPNMQLLVFGTKNASNMIVVMECVEEAI